MSTAFDRMQTKYDHLTPEDLMISKPSYSEELEEKIESSEEAMHMLIKELFDCSEEVDEFKIWDCLTYLSKDLGVDIGDFPKNQMNIMSVKKLDQIRKIAKRAEDSNKEFLKRNLNVIKKEIYGNRPLNSFMLDACITNICWNLGETPDSERKINVERARG